MYENVGLLWYNKCQREIAHLTRYAHINTVEQRTLYSNTVIGSMAVDRWTVTFGTARRSLGELRPRPVPSSLYQMQQPTNQRQVYQLYIIWCGTIIASGL